MEDQLSAILTGNMNFAGQKSFSIPPKLSSSSDDFDDDSFITKKYAGEFIGDSGVYVGVSSEVVNISDNIFNPLNDNSTGCTRAGEDSFLTWRIPVNGNDSTKWPGGNDGVECKSTGHLVVYGWLQDSGYVVPQEAWVAIYGKVTTGNGQTNWVLLQLQPWPVTDKSSIIQYVGFNIPVQKGLKLKIKTGFKVADSATGTNLGNTLTLEQVEPNTFIGYIIK